MALAELFAAVYANPDDDDVRLVLADALVAIGDPRGELIQLAFNDRHDQSRARKLIQQHGLTWLGALRGHVIPHAYEKGFVSACAVLDVAGCVGKPELATLRSIAISEGQHALLADPNLRGLRRVATDAVDELLRYPAVLARLSSIAVPWEPAVEHIDAFLGLEKLQRLDLGSRGVRLVRGPDGRLSRLEATYRHTEIDQIVRRLPHLTEIVVPGSRD